MLKTDDLQQLDQLVRDAGTILIVQPDKPDGDSLATAMALEEILGDMGKDVIIFCAGRVEPYLRYIPGHDRVTPEWPNKYDLALMVDVPAPETLPRVMSEHHKTLASKPWVVIDHHGARKSMEGETLEIIEAQAAATSEVLWRIARKLGWAVNPNACRLMASSILADTLNLTTPSVTPRTLQAFAEIASHGEVSVAELHARYREHTALDPDIVALKGRIMASLETFDEGRIAIVTIPGDVLDQYRERVSPGAIVLPELLWARGVEVAVAISAYPNLVRTSLRARIPVAGTVATMMGGGGHPMAAAFPRETSDIEALKKELVENLSQEIQSYHAALQHSDAHDRNSDAA